MHRMPYLFRSLSTKEPCILWKEILWLFYENPLYIVALLRKPPVYCGSFTKTPCILWLFYEKSPVYCGKRYCGSFYKRALYIVERDIVALLRKEPQSTKEPCILWSHNVSFHKRALYIVALLRKETCNVRHPTFIQMRYRVAKMHRMS